MITAILLSLFLAGVINVEQFKTGQKIVNAINSVNYDEAVNDICYANNDLCNIVRGYKNDFRKWYKQMLFSIAYAESKFKYNEGLYDKDDIGYFQINTKIWTKEKAKKYLNFDYYDETILKYDINLQANMALRILLYNIAVKIRQHGRQKSIYKYTLLYHKLNHHVIPESYKNDIKKILWR